MEVRAEDKKLIEETQTLTKEYVELLKEWLPKRRVTVAKIREIAAELQNTRRNVNISKVVGGSVGVLGGITAVTGAVLTVMTVGLAAPIFITGVVATVAGTATSSGAGLVEYFISSGQLHSVQDLLDNDKKLTQKVEEKKKLVDANVEILSTLYDWSKDEIFLAMLMSAMPRSRFFRMEQVFIFNVLMSNGISIPLVLCLRGGSAFGKGMGVFTEVSLGGISRVIGSVLPVLLVGAMLVLDIYFLVKNSIELADGSPTAAADSLREIADKLGKQADDIETVLEQIREKSGEYEAIIAKDFQKLLEKVAVQESASDKDSEKIITYIRQHASNRWCQGFQSMDVNVNIFVFEIARVFWNFQRIIQNHLRRYKGHVNITLISHGRIDPSSRIPSQIYYLTENLKSITCYSPWGCAVDASVVYGIATNTIQILNVRYSGPVRPSIPGGFNTLPESMELTPNVIFSPVMHGEGAHRALLKLISILQGPSDGLVIPYFTGLGNDLLPFPEIPLWVVANAIAICASLLNITVSLRIAACLSTGDVHAFSHVLDRDGFYPALTQYCQVPMNRKPPVIMTNQMTLTQNLLLQLDEIRADLFL